MRKHLLLESIIFFYFTFYSFCQENIAIVNTNIIPMTENIVLENQTILISNGAIEALGNSANISIPENYRLINGEGKFIIPGLINMYTHVNETNVLLYLANGQTTVRDIPSHINVLGLREKINNKEILGPRIISYGLRATGAPAPYHSQQPIFTEKQGREQVQEAKRLSYDGMYIYATCSPITYNSILDEAEKNQLPISGHFPILINEDEVIESKQPEFTNLTGLTRGGKLTIDKNKLISQLKKYNKAITPSLAVHKIWSLSHRKDSIYNSDNMKYIPPKLRINWKPDAADNSSESAYPYNEVAKLIKELSDNDIQLFLGSDGGYPLVVPGFAYLDELELFVKSGISNYKTLKYATIDAAKFLGLKNIGTVKVGKKAELVVLNSNPFNDINAIRNIYGVVVNNRWLDKPFFNAQLAELEKKTNNVSNRFKDWVQYLSSNNKTTQIDYTFFSYDSEVGQQKILIDSLENRTVEIRSVMVADGPDYRETYSYHRIRNKKIDSVSIINMGSEGVTKAIMRIERDSVNISGFSPFHGAFNYQKFVAPQTQLWNPFISRYFELDNMVNYHLAQSLNNDLEVNQANIFNTIQVELNSEEFGEKYIVDEAVSTILRTSEKEFRVIYPGFSGFPNRTSLPFNVHIKMDVKNIISEILYENYRLIRDSYTN